MKSYDKPRLPRIIFGNDSSKKVGKLLKEYSVTNCLIVTDVGIKKLGIIDKIAALLDAEGITYDIFDEAVPNPPDYVCLKVGKILKEGTYNGVLGIGGGSPLDVAKAGSLIAGIDEEIDDLHEYRRGAEKAKNDWKRPYPLINITTTSGTGAEATASAVITNTKDNLKFSFGNEAIAADVAIIDPLFTVGMPPVPTANGAFDALAHAVEDVVGCAQNEYTNLILLDCIERVWKWMPIAMKDPQDIEAREQLSWAAHNALANGGVPNGHAVAHAISSLYHLVHGHSCVLVLPTVIRHHATTSATSIAEIAKKIGVPTVGDAIVDAERVAKALKKFYEDAGFKNLRGIMKDNGFDDSKETYIKKMVPFVLDDYKSRTWNPPIHLDEAICANICSLVYDED